MVAKGLFFVKRVIISAAVIRRIKNWLIYCAVRSAMVLVGFTPAGWVRGVGRAVGAVAHWLAVTERELAMDQLSCAYGKSISKRRVALLTKGLFVHLGCSAVEICRTLRHPQMSPPIVLRAGGEQTLRRALAPKRGVVFVTAHLGNWELMAQALAAHGFPISTVAKPSYDPRFTALIERFRSRGAVQSIYRGAKRRRPR